MQSYYQKIYGTSRGLICFSSSQEEQIYVWNPVINKYRSLPDAPVPSKDPPWSCKRTGLAFGYIGQIDDYKVIKLDINYRIQSEELQSDYANVYIYSLSTNSWKTLRRYDFARFRSYSSLYNSVVINGVAYWVLNHWNLQYDKDGFEVILCFDTVKETIREMMLPPVCSEHNRNSTYYVNLVGEFDEVSLLCVDIDENIGQLWMLEKEGETNNDWTKMITLNLKDVGEDWCPIGFNNNLEFVLINYDFDKPGLCTYDHKLEEVTEMVDDSSDLWSYADFEDPYNPFFYSQEEMQPMYVNIFEESLVLLGEEGEVEFRDD
ncbi:hypothetical protein POM88_052841 [Heracleum sosnowskyi]|uniref:F-box associated beta-propeller type 1 domain-containing protein n=1 Tax=Heracleum sosnowskyi TaxID=360622 RepID=A0AAD8GR24_9APIA|nr:hypothetical protein POM88_052841 [Heracleum sosnowskyi]